MMAPGEFGYNYYRELAEVCLGRKFYSASQTVNGMDCDGTFLSYEELHKFKQQLRDKYIGEGKEFPYLCLYLN